MNTTRDPYAENTTLTETTSSYTMPSKDECIREILHFAKKLSEKKWWQDESYETNQIKLYAKAIKIWERK